MEKTEVMTNDTLAVQDKAEGNDTFVDVWKRQRLWLMTLLQCKKKIKVMTLLLMQGKEEGSD